MTRHNFAEFLDPSNVSRATAAFRETIVSGAPSPTIELQMRRKNGEVFTGELNARRYEMDGQLGTIGIIRDVTERNNVKS